jgi:hypothetical protein
VKSNNAELYYRVEVWLTEAGSGTRQCGTNSVLERLRKDNNECRTAGAT